MLCKNIGVSLILFLVLWLPVRISGQTLSDEARISLLTCQPGTDVYSVFGHSAIHVYDPPSSIDLVFNYGVFSFGSDFFIWNFVRGKTDYKLAIQSMNRFKQEYHAEGRWVVSHTFNLSRRQKEEMFAFLLENSRPENAEYRYNFFFDNCATRIRDVLFLIVRDSIDINYQSNYFFSPPGLHEKKELLTANHQNNPRFTFRNLIDLYLKDYAWLDFGVDVVLGKDTDRTASLYQQMFLPDFLMFILSNSTQNIHGVRFPVIKQYEVLVEPVNKLTKKPIPFLLTPLFITLVIFILSLFVTINGLINRKPCTAFDSVLFILLGLGGFVVFFVSYFSVHPVVNPNFNLLWVHPLHLFYGIMLICKFEKRTLYAYHYLSMLLISLFFFLWIADIQYFHPASILLAATLFIRGIHSIYLRKTS